MRGLVVLLGALALCTCAMAQGGGWAAVRGISPGSPVEVQLSPHGTAKGAVASVSASGMGVQNSDGSVRQVPKEQIAKVYLLEDSHKLRDALIGAGAGAAGGVALGIAVYNGGACCADYYPTSQQQPHPVSKAVATAVYGAALAAVGAAIGAIIGSRHSKTLVYQRAPGPPTHSQARWGGRRAGTRR